MTSSGPVTVRHLDEFPVQGQGVFVPVRKALGVSSFGINVERWPAHSDGHPEHDEGTTGQEEVYVCLSGAATLRADGQEYALRPGVFARVSPGVTRQIVTTDEPVEVLCLGGIPGGVYPAS